MHPAATGAMVGGGVGFVFAAVRRGDEEPMGGKATRIVKSVAEGAAAGAAVGFLLDRRARTAAAALIAERGPELVEAARAAYEAARPQVEQAI
ncbi:MAG: hypothetical protein ACRD0G_16540, partial [Acidimicrobiales bacterium]